MRIVRFACLAGVLAIFPPRPARCQVVLNEVMANNVSTVANGDAYPDWIEIYNSGATSVNLGGLSLTNVGSGKRFVFPANTLMGPFGYLIVWCDSAASDPGFHTGFGLKSSGEAVALYSADGITQLDAVSFGLQLPDLTIGRVPDGPAGSWTLNEPTPALANQGKA